MGRISNWTRYVTTSATDTSFSAVGPTVALPSGAVALSRGGAEGFNTLQLQPFGSGNDDTTFSMRVFGWRKAGGTLWQPAALTEVSATLSTAVGIAGQAVINTERFADAIAAAATPIGLFIAGAVPANHVATMEVDVSGCEFFSLTFDLTGATGANALYAIY